MLIRCKLFRAGVGTKLSLGKGKDARHYHFLPAEAKGLTGQALDRVMADPDLDHVCDVKSKDDVSTLLAIREGYELHDSVLDDDAPTGKAEKNETSSANRNYSSMKKPDLLKLIGGRLKGTGKAMPHGTTPMAKLIEILEDLDSGTGA